MKNKFAKFILPADALVGQALLLRLLPPLLRFSPGCGAVMAAARVTATSPNWLMQLHRGLSLVGGRISRPMGARESTWFGKLLVELSRTKSRVEDHLIETRNHTSTAPLHSTHRGKSSSSIAKLNSDEAGCSVAQQMTFPE